MYLFCFVLVLILSYMALEIQQAMIDPFKSQKTPGSSFSFFPLFCFGLRIFTSSVILDKYYIIPFDVSFYNRIEV